ncbi:MAG TPA: hypothetical protein VJS64_10180 [Pyrinomonadaceae bacterium]|nr:hypothetical protein [Pyrinomonadaceae bacterium]
MRFQQSKRLKAVAAFLMFAVVQISVQFGFAETGPNAPLPVPQQFIARLRTRGNNPITVNGNSAASGASLVTGALIETGADSSATIDIADFTLDVAPNTRLRLDYDDQGRVKVFLISGCAIARSRGDKTQVEFQTADNVTQGQTAKKRGGAIDVCFINGQATVNQNAAANAGAGAGAGATAAGGGGGGGLSTAAIAAIVIGAATATVITIVAVTNDDDNPSPSSPSR